MAEQVEDGVYLKNEIPIMLAILGPTMELERPVPLLAELVCLEVNALKPTHRRWEIGPKTFERLIEALLVPHLEIESQRNIVANNLRGGMFELSYRQIPLQVHKHAPEGRLWPA